MLTHAPRQAVPWLIFDVGRKMKFDLPRDTEVFLRHPAWDFTLTCDGCEFQASMQEVPGLREDEELPFFRATVVRAIGWKREALRVAADCFYDDFLRKWNRGGPISREEFTSRLRLTGVFIESDRSVAMEFDDEHDMFWGHAVVIRFDSGGRLREAELLG